jgi:hypothetical protein
MGYPIQKKGHEIKQIRGKYYLYTLESKYDKDLKKSVKLAGEYLGTITPEGFNPKKIMLPHNIKLHTKEYGATAFLYSLSEDIRKVLNDVYINNTVADSLFSLALLRVLGTTAFKRMELEYAYSYISEIIPEVALSGPTISNLLMLVGQDRELMNKCLFLTRLNH